MTMSLHTEASEVVGVQDLQEEVCCSIRIGAALPHFVQQGMLNRYSKLTGLPNSILLRISLKCQGVQLTLEQHWLGVLLYIHEGIYTCMYTVKDL